MGLSRVFGLCAAFLLAAPVSAAVTIDLGPSDYRNWGSGSYQNTPGGVRSSFGQTVRIPPTLNTLNVTRNPVVPYGSLVNGMKNFVRITPGSVAASAAVTAAFMAMDWYFDQDLGEWVKDEESIIDDPDFGLWQVNSNQPESCKGTYSDPAAYCELKKNCVYPNATKSAVRITSSTNMACLVNLNSSTEPVYTNFVSTRIAECPGGSVYQPATGVCVGAATGLPLTASDWAALEGELVTMPPAIVGGSANDVMERHGQIPGYHDTTITGPSSVTGTETTTTTTDPVTGDTTVTTSQTTTNISYGDTTITTTSTTTTNTYTNGTHTSTTTTTETPGELPVTEPSPVGAAEWPGFCEWASIVCDWIGWTQEEAPAEPDLPQVIDDDFYEEKEIQFGSKTCPPDYEISIPFINSVVAVPMQPLCDFAGIIYYMVMAAAYIIAAYITIGVARNG